MKSWGKSEPRKHHLILRWLFEIQIIYTFYNEEFHILNVSSDFMTLSQLADMMYKRLEAEVRAQKHGITAELDRRSLNLPVHYIENKDKED
jgi:hypothetical protein